MFQAMTQLLNSKQINTQRSSQWCVKAVSVLLLAMLSSPMAYAQETVCAEVKIEIAQELTIERQAFEAKLEIENTLTDKSITDINVVVLFTDNNGDEVLATSDSTNTAADFFIRVNSLTGIDNVEGSGVLGAGQTATAAWLIIPSPGASDGIPSGKLVFVGARFEYKLDGIDAIIEVAPDSIYVKPTPLLGLDYFLPRNVFADDPLTDEVEPVEPFTLGVRVQNNGSGLGQSIKIESAQPTIVENEEGLAIDFRLLDSFVQDQEVSNSLLIDFEDIPSGEAKMGRWIMTTSLSGRFTEFDAEYSHSDELGGELTSLLESVETHFLLRDVLVDAPGRDSVKDFLAYDFYDDLLRMPDEIKVFESNSTTMPVANLSSAVVFNNNELSGGGFSFTTNPQAGFMYAEIADPFTGSKVITRALRSDGKEMNLSNVWLSKRYDSASKETTVYLNVFDFNTTGDYTIFLETPVFDPRPPVWQQVPYRDTVEGQTLGFIVQASDPDGTIPVLTAVNLPAGATFSDNGTGFGGFQWTPALGQAGSYTVQLIAIDDGGLSQSIDMFIEVNAAGDSDGDGLPDDWEIEQFGDLENDGTEDSDGDGVSDLDEYLNGTDPNTQDAPLAPTIVTPVFEATVDSLSPELVIENSQYDGPLTVVYVFEVFSDPAYGEDDLVSAYYAQEQGEEGQTAWLVTAELVEDSDYFWRVRASNSFTYSPWVDGRFRVNSENTQPNAPNISSPTDGMDVNPNDFALVAGNARDVDGDALSYTFFVYDDLAGSTLLGQSPPIAQQDMGMTQWQPTISFTDGIDYYWRVSVSDGIAEPVASDISSFRLAVVNQAPNEPTISSPTIGQRVATDTPVLIILDSVDDNSSASLEYLFEVDSSELFDSNDKISSGWLSDNGTEPTFSWQVSEVLLEDQTYYWRVKARDIDALESAWVVSSLTVNAINTAPAVPTIKNPGDDSQVITLNPKLEAHPVVDVDGDSIEYVFELSDDINFVTITQTARVQTSEFSLEPLEDDHIYYWRVKAIDETGVESNWSPRATFFVNENNFDNAPEFTWLLPEGSTTVHEGDSVTLRWQDEDPDSSATISLFYADNEQGVGRVLISDSISEDPDLESDTYLWSTSGLAPGDYYLFAVIDDVNSSEGVAAQSVFVIHVDQTLITELLSPLAGTVLESETVTFTWKDIGADNYRLLIGSTLGGSELVDSDVGTQTTATINTIPNDGSLIYVVISTTKSGIVTNSDAYEFVTGVNDELTNILISPVPSSTLDSSVVTFEWNDVGATNYRLLIGTESGATDLGNINVGTGLSRTIGNLPDDGSSVFVSIRVVREGITDTSPIFEFITGEDKDLVNIITSPVPSSTLDSSIVTFTWNDIGATNYRLILGTAPDLADLGNINVGTGLSRTVGNLPDDGSKVYARIQVIRSSLSHQSPVFEYTTGPDGDLANILTSPTPGSELDSAVVSFTWNDIGATNYRLLLGSSPTNTDFGNINVGTGLSRTVGNLPDDGSSVFARIQVIRDNLTHISPAFEYTSGPDKDLINIITSPTPGSELDSSVVDFTWNNVGATNYRLLLGSSPTNTDFGNINVGTGLSRTVGNLPDDGSSVFARIQVVREGLAHISPAFEFVAGKDKELENIITSPTANSTLDSSVVTFNWKSVTGAKNYRLLLGSQPDLTDFGNINVGTTLSKTIGNLPVDGSKVYARIQVVRTNFTHISPAFEYTTGPDKDLVNIITSPTPGSTFDSSVINFTWNDIGAFNYRLLLGSSPTSTDFGDIYVGTSLSRTVGNLPDDGSSVFARIQVSREGLTHISPAFEYVTGKDIELENIITSPTANTTLDSRVVTFEWNDIGATNYQLLLGSQPDLTDFASINLGTKLSATVGDLPIDGSSVFARIRVAREGLVHFSPAFEFVTGEDKELENIITSPAANTTLDSSVVTFNWESVAGAKNYRLLLGSQPDLTDFGNINVGTTLSKTIGNLPVDGSKVYARIQVVRANFTHVSPAFEYTTGPDKDLANIITSPTPGSTFDSSVINFTWNDIGAFNYRLLLGSSPTSTDFGDIYVGTGLSRAIGNLPDDGSSVFARIQVSREGLTHISPAFEYVTGKDIELENIITSPTANSTLDSGIVTFEWNDVGAINYRLLLGSQPDLEDLGNINVGTNLSRTVGNLPEDGSSVYARIQVVREGLAHISPAFEYTTGSE